MYMSPGAKAPHLYTSKSQTYPEYATDKTVHESTMFIQSNITPYV